VNPNYLQILKRKTIKTMAPISYKTWPKGTVLLGCFKQAKALEPTEEPYLSKGLGLGLSLNLWTCRVPPKPFGLLEEPYFSKALDLSLWPKKESNLSKESGFSLLKTLK